MLFKEGGEEKFTQNSSKIKLYAHIFYSLLNRIFLLRCRSKLLSPLPLLLPQSKTHRKKNVFHHNEKYLKVFFNIIFHSITEKQIKIEGEKKVQQLEPREKSILMSNLEFFCSSSHSMLKIKINILMGIYFNENVVKDTFKRLNYIVVETKLVKLQKENLSSFERKSSWSFERNFDQISSKKSSIF